MPGPLAGVCVLRDLSMAYSLSCHASECAHKATGGAPTGSFRLGGESAQSLPCAFRALERAWSSLGRPAGGGGGGSWDG